MKKEQNPEERIATLTANILQSQEHWKDIQKNGCNDPFWSDGCNMNLVRNHIIHNKTTIAEICLESGLSLPAEYYTPTPPKVDDNYMANLKQKERVERLRQSGSILTNQCPAYNSEQLDFF